MNKNGLVAIAVVVLVIVGGVVIANGRDDSNDQPTSTTQTTGSNGSSSGSSDSPAPPAPSSSSTSEVSDDNSAEVEIEDFAFQPGNLTVKKGTKVKWTNKDSVAHNVIGSNGGPSSGTLNKGDEYEFTFTETGTFSYVCTLHANMTATITVVD